MYILMYILMIGINIFTEKICCRKIDVMCVYVDIYYESILNRNCIVY